MPEHHYNARLFGHKLIRFILINNAPPDGDHQKRNDAANGQTNKGITNRRSYQFFNHAVKTASGLCEFRQTPIPKV